ncbi:MAG: glycosyltransferase family 4 protein [Candidatus Moranbacteria bacterium]|nr:glycosyltransferase family 4 protein [Candidatus Moranbacteria bacterium]
MKIGINASFLRKPNTGIGQVTLNFLRELSGVANKKDEFILYLEEELPKGLELPSGFKCEAFLPSLYRRDDLIRKIWWEKYALPKRAKKDGCEVFLSLYQCPTVMPKSIKHIVLVHDIIPKLFPEYLNNLRKKIYQNMIEAAIKKADRLIAVSKHTEKDIINHLGIPGDKIAVDYIDVDRIYKKKPSAEARKKVLGKYKLKPGYIFAGGGMELRKNIGSVIWAYKMLLDRNSREHFIHDFPRLAIFGHLMPELAPLVTDAENLVAELNLKKHVELLGSVPQDSLPALYAESLFFIYPSLYEGFGMPVLEAMNQEKPVIASKTSSLPEVGGDGVLYCKPNDVADVAMVMKNLIMNHELRRSLSERAKERAKKFSWKVFTKKVLNIIESVE